MSKSQKSYWLKSGMLTILERGSVFVFGFGGFYLLTRAFTTEEGDANELGIWVIFYTITSFMEVARSGLLQNALVKYLAEAKDGEYPIINTASLTINLILTGVFVLLLMSLAYPAGQLWDEQTYGLSGMLYVYCITVILMIPFHQFNFIQMANLDFRGVFWSNFTRQGLFFFYILSVVLFDWEVTLVYLAIVQAICTLFAVLVNTILAWPYLRFSKNIDREQMKRLFNFGRFVFGTNISTMVYKRIDTLMLGSLLMPASAAIYEWAIKITNLTEVPTFSIASIVFPQAARISQTNDKKELKVLYEKSVGAILALIIPFVIIVCVFAEWIINILAGESFSETIRVLQMTIFFGCFIPFAVLFGTILDAMGKPKINFYFTIGGSVINIISNYIFITNFGVIGAAIGTLTSYIVTFIAMQYVLNTILGIRAYRAFIYVPGFYKQGLSLARNFLDKKKVASET